MAWDGYRVSKSRPHGLGHLSDVAEGGTQEPRFDLAEPLVQFLKLTLYRQGSVCARLNGAVDETTPSSAFRARKQQTGLPLHQCLKMPQLHTRTAPNPAQVRDK